MAQQFFILIFFSIYFLFQDLGLECNMTLHDAATVTQLCVTIENDRRF